MYKFIKTKDEKNEFDNSNVEITIPDNEILLSDLLEEFECFLKAAGYCFDGTVDIVEEIE